MFCNTLSSIANSARSGAVIRVASALAVVFALASASGCALLSDNLEKAAKAAGKTVTAYCENVTVAEVRAEIAAAVNAKAAPHKVEITCADELPPAAPAGDAVAPVAWNPILIIERWLRPIFDPASVSAA